MADFYASMDALKAAETQGVDYQIEARVGDQTLIMAPHGGAIEGGTTELARAIAANDHGFYSFMGLKGSGNAKLHITSTQFVGVTRTKFVGEALCKAILESAERVVALHGVKEGDVTFVGGLDTDLRERIVDALQRHGFPVSTESPDGLGGVSERNVCNRGTSGKGVQIEIARSLRQTLFGGSISAEARADAQRRDPLFHTFVSAIREALDGP